MDTEASMTQQTVSRQELAKRLDETEMRRARAEAKEQALAELLEEMIRLVLRGVETGEFLRHVEERLRAAEREANEAQTKQIKAFDEWLAVFKKEIAQADTAWLELHEQQSPAPAAGRKEHP